MSNTILSLENVSFSYGKTKIIKNLTLSVEEGSFTTLLGASGCGKSTILRLIAGFLHENSGKIKIDNVDQHKLEPNKRNVGLVFQDYALFPHLSVAKNIAYGLKLRSFSKDFIKNCVADVCEKLGIAPLLSRYPQELSGGQQQRVALARALVLKPKLLLMDEPLSSLDTSLREKVRTELKEIQQKLKLTTIYVTHDQAEAFSLSDKIAVIDGGKILQEGTPTQIYFEPKNQFVAQMTGRVNFIQNAQKIDFVRPEWLELCEQKNADFAGTVDVMEFLGAMTRIFVQTKNAQIVADIPTFYAQKIQIGEKIALKATHRTQIDL